VKTNYISLFFFK